MTEKGFNLFDEYAARCVHLFPQKEECTPSSYGLAHLMYTSGSIVNSQRMLTKINGNNINIKDI